MRIKIHLLLIACAILAFTTSDFSQTPRTVRWEGSDANSKRILRKDSVAKQILVDGVDGITVTASVQDRSNLESFSVELEVSNHSQRNLDLRTHEIQFQVIRPGSKNLSMIPADALARKVLASENSRADDIELRGASATKTETKTVVEHVPSSVAAADPTAATDPTRIVLQKTSALEVVQRTVTETVPDETKRNQSKLEASQIRRDAEAERKQILSTALKTTPITSNSQIGGRVYYAREKKIEEILLRIPLGELTVEIPFTAVKKRALLAPATIKFE